MGDAGGPPQGLQAPPARPPAASPRSRRGIAAVAAIGLHLLALAGLAGSVRPRPVEPSTAQGGPAGVAVILRILGPRADETSPRRERPPPLPAPPRPAPTPEAHALAFEPSPLPASESLALEPPTVRDADLTPAPLPTTVAPTGDAAGAAASRPEGAAAPVASPTCDILEAMSRRFGASAELRLALAAIPRSTRSVANAVLLWDRAWADPAEMGGAPTFGTIRRAVVAVIAAAPPACGREIVRGPRLVAIADPHDTVVLAFGSGEWRWSDLTDAAAPSGVR